MTASNSGIWILEAVIAKISSRYHEREGSEVERVAGGFQVGTESPSHCQGKGRYLVEQAASFPLTAAAGTAPEHNRFCQRVVVGLGRFFNRFIH